MGVATITSGWTPISTAYANDERDADALHGGVDTRFGSGEVVMTPTALGASADYQRGLAVQHDGKILVGGMSEIGERLGGLQWRLTRYTRHGDLDTTFGSDGTVLTNMSS